MTSTGVPSTAFRRDVVVRFGQVDAAGLVFYPRYFEMISDTMEAWFADALDAPFARLHLERREGTPAVSVNAAFLAPSRLGDRLTLHLWVREVGRSRMDLAVAATCGEEMRLKAELTHVFVSLDPLRSEALPEDLRARMAAFRAPATAE